MSTASTLAERLGRFQNGLGGATASTAVIGLLGAVSGILLARTLGPAPRGEYAAIVLWPTALAIVGELGFNFSISYHCGKGRSISALWSLTWVVSLGVGGALALAGIVVVPALVTLPDQAERDLIWALATAPAALVTGNLAYLLLGTGRVALYNWVRVYAAASYSLLIAALALAARGNLETYTVAFVFSQVSSALLAAGVVARAGGRPLDVFVPPSIEEAVAARLEELGAQLTVCRRNAGVRGDPTYAAMRRAIVQRAGRAR